MKSIKEYLNGLDANPGQCNELKEKGIGIFFQIREEIDSILKSKKEKSGYKETIEDRAERIAFENRGHISKDSIDQEVLSYWRKRASESKNVLFKSRYSDLIVDFDVKAKDRFQLAQCVIDSNIEIAKQRLVDPLQCGEMLRRAFDLSCQFKNTGNLEKTAKAIYEFILADDIFIKNKPGLWIWGFELFLVDNKQISKTKIYKSHASQLRKRLEAEMEKSKGNRFLAEKLFYILSRVFEKEQDEDAEDAEDAILNILKIFEASIIADCENEKDDMKKFFFYNELIKECQRYESMGYKKIGKFKKEIYQKHNNFSFEMEHFSMEVPINPDAMNFLIAFILKEDNSLGTIIKEIACFFLTQTETSDANPKNLADFFPCLTVGSDGRILAQTEGSSFVEKKVAISLNMQVLRILLSQGLKKRFSAEDVAAYFYEQPIFKDEPQEYLLRVFKAFWEEDFLVSSHLFIPLIERTIRKIVESEGTPILKPNCSGGQNVKSLESLLGDLIGTGWNEPRIDIENLREYMKFVLIDSKGFNLRDDGAHGLETDQYFDEVNSLLLFHIMTCLSLVRKSEVEKKQ